MILDAAPKGRVSDEGASTLIIGVTELVFGDSTDTPVLSCLPGMLSGGLKEVAFSDLLTLSLNKLLAMSLDI